MLVLANKIDDPAAESLALEFHRLGLGEPLWFDDLPKNGKGYREATAVIERRIHELFDELERTER